MTDLRATFSPELVEALERLVDERVQAAVAELHPNGAGSSSPWLSLSEAAEYLRTSERTVQRLVKRSRIRTSTIGRRRLFHRDDLDALARATTGEEVAPTTPSRRRVRSLDPEHAEA